MKQEAEILEWEGNAVKDTVTYRYIELALSVIELAVEENQGLLTTYQTWIDKQKSSSDDLKSAIFSEFTPEENTKITIFSLPTEKEFLAKFETPAFNVAASFSYNFDKRDLIAARLIHFKGDYNLAVAWAEDILMRIDDAFAKLENN